MKGFHPIYLAPCSTPAGVVILGSPVTPHCDAGLLMFNPVRGWFCGKKPGLCFK